MLRTDELFRAARRHVSTWTLEAVSSRPFAYRLTMCTGGVSSSVVLERDRGGWLVDNEHVS